jgi:uncharacterized membrane protein
MARAARVTRLVTPLGALWAAIASFAVGFSALALLRHDAFATGRFDLGNMVQAVWSTAHGHPLRVTNLHGDQVLRLGAHVDPMLVLLAPLWWLWPSADMLLVLQNVAMALGALPVFLLARKHLGSERAGVAFALVYLLYPATTWTALNEFHPVALATPLLLAAIWALDEDRLVLFGVFALLAATTKEEIPLVIAALGVWYALTRRRFLVGSAIAAAGVAWSALAFAVVIPHYNRQGSAFYGRYSEVGGTPGGIVHTVVTDPGRLFSVAFDHAGVHYLIDLVLPLAGLCLLSPLALAAVPELALNLLSSTPTQTSIHFHYVAGEIPPLVAAAVLGAKRITRYPAATAALFAALAGNYLLGAIPIWRALPGGETLQAHAQDVSEHDRIATRALRLIPHDAVVSATNSLGAHLSERRRVLSFPFLQDATWVAADETQPGYSDRVAPLPTAVQLVWLRRNPAWRLVFEEDGVLVFRRVLPP